MSSYTEGFYLRRFHLQQTPPASTSMLNQRTQRGNNYDSNQNYRVTSSNFSEMPTFTREAPDQRTSTRTVNSLRLVDDSSGRQSEKKARSNSTRRDQKYAHFAKEEKGNGRDNLDLDKDSVQEKKSSKKISWSNCEIDPGKVVKRVCQKLHIEESVLVENQRQRSTSKRRHKGTHKARKTSPFVSYVTTTDDDDTEDNQETEEDFDNMNFDSFLADCDASFEDLRCLIEEKDTTRMRPILSVIAGKYVERMEKEWGKRRDLWLAGQYYVQNRNGEEFESAYECKTFKEAVQSFKVMLRVPFDLETVLEFPKNPVLVDDVNKDETEMESKVPSNFELGDRKEIVASETKENDVPAGEMSSKGILKPSNGQQGKEKEPGEVNVNSANQDKPGVWNDLRKSEKDSNSNGVSNWWEPLYSMKT